MSDVKTIQFNVEQSVLDNGVKILFAIVEGLDNTAVTPEWLEYREPKIAELRDRYEGIDFHADPILEGFHILHDNAGVKRRKNIPASENLIRLLTKKGDMPIINQAVDIYNLISVDSKLSLGAHNIDNVDGNVTLRFTDGTEKFHAIGAAEAGVSAAHEYSYCDDANEVLCRLEIRQVEKTKVDESAKNVFYIVQGNEATEDALLEETAQQIIDLTTKYCGGKGWIVKPEVV